MPQDLFDDEHFLGKGLVPSGKKPLPDLVLTQICVAIWCPVMVSLDHNDMNELSDKTSFHKILQRRKAKRFGC